MKLVELKVPNINDINNAMEVINKLREDLLSGKISAFYGVSIEDDDTIASWSVSTKSVSYLRAQGAVSHLLHCLHTGDA